MANRQNRPTLYRMVARIVRSRRASAAGALLVALAAGCATTPIGGPRAPEGDPAAGLLVRASGRGVPVYPAELHFTGRAEYRWPDGRVYDGDWLNGLPHGEGTEILPDGETYAGHWQTGHRHGLGELLPAGGGLYQGEFIAGVRQGKGIQFGADGVYQGDWYADHEHGYGELAGAEGSRYAGQWEAGLRSGPGAFRGADGSSYEGEWRNDLPDGFGIFRFRDGAVYEGHWQAGRQQGIGRLQAVSGVVYEGSWAAARRDGFGVEQRPDGSQYAGGWQADERNGDGRETWADGSFHDGRWTSNRMQGPGLRHYHTGIEIQGDWTGDRVSSGRLSLPGRLDHTGPLFRSSDGQPAKTLVRWVEGAAAKGNPGARLLAATLVLDYPHPLPDVARARAWLVAAADAGVSDAAFRLAVLMLEQGRADEAAAALRRLRQAADAGHAEALRVQGDLHAARIALPEGMSPPVDDAAAIADYREALRAGSPLAAERLARLLVTTREPSLRDPVAAIASLEWVALYTGYWQHLDTLALAYAANHDPTSAVLAEVRAIAAATPPPGPEPFPTAPAPRSGTPAPAASKLITPPPVEPDLEAMRARLARYRAAAAESGS